MLPFRISGAVHSNAQMKMAPKASRTSGLHCQRCKFNFTATPNTGWHFKQWILAKRGANSYPSGTPHDNGSNTFSVEVGVQDIDLAAVFERDSYTLTLEGELTASYQTVDPNDTSKTLTKSLKSGESVTGDTEITVAPKAGYAAATSETYQVNGKAVEAGKLNADGSYTFPITENTKVSLKTDRAAFAITTPEMGMARSLQP